MSLSRLASLVLAASLSLNCGGVEQDGLRDIHDDTNDSGDDNTDGQPEKPDYPYQCGELVDTAYCPYQDFTACEEVQECVREEIVLNFDGFLTTCDFLDDLNLFDSSYCEGRDPSELFAMEGFEGSEGERDQQIEAIVAFTRCYFEPLGFIVSVGIPVTEHPNIVNIGGIAKRLDNGNYMGGLTWQDCGNDNPGSSIFVAEYLGDESRNTHAGISLTALHEIGHALGLVHEPGSDVMRPVQTGVLSCDTQFSYGEAYRLQKNTADFCEAEGASEEERFDMFQDVGRCAEECSELNVGVEKSENIPVTECHSD